MSRVSVCSRTQGEIRPQSLALLSSCRDLLHRPPWKARRHEGALLPFASAGLSFCACSSPPSPR